jgi:hypothetical protein
MAVPINRPNSDVMMVESTTSIATSPVPASMIAPCKGWVERVMAGAAGATTGTITVAVSINGGADITNGHLTIPAGSGGPGNVLELSYSSTLPYVNEGDVITFTPSGGTGTNIGGAFALVIRK